jgi:serine-type D-Ala-D-Ala carboxypeptidase (penicillin-binding protein 5/6)
MELTFQVASFTADRLARGPRRLLALALALMLVACGTADAPAAPRLADSGEPATAGEMEPVRDDRPLALTRVIEATGLAPELREVVPMEDLTAAAAILVDEASGAVIYARAADTPRAPASVTKIATAILALESGRLNDVVDVDVHYIEDFNFDDRVVGLVPGDRFTLRSLVYALMLSSGNDAAVAIARAVGGSDEAFVGQMNALAQDLGLTVTHFIDPHGIGGFGHYTTPRDLATLTRYAFRLPGFAEIVSTRYIEVHGTQTLSLWNASEFLYYYDWADGVKVGFTEEAGNTLVASATRDGRRLIAVVLNAPLPVTDARLLLDWGWSNLCWPAPEGGCVGVEE